MAKNIIVVKGTNRDGRKFRPSDWIERLASCFASYTAQKRLAWHEGCKPVYINDEKCLAIDTTLQSDAPAIWNHVINFVTSNNLIIIEKLNNTAVESDDLCSTEAA